MTQVYTREDARKAIVTKIKSTLASAGVENRVKWPGFAPIDIATNKTPYLNVDIVYQDGESVGLGPTSPQRRIGTIVVEINYKEGAAKDLADSNNILDVLASALTATDSMYPVRTYATRPVSPPSGVQQGWMREGLVTPFWFDTAR